MATEKMVEIGEVSEHGVCRNSSIGVIDDSLKQVVALSISRSRNPSPLSRCGLRNTSIWMKKGWRHLVKAVTFRKGVHLDVQTWANLPEDLLKEILARVPPFLIFRLRSVCKRWNSILHDSSFWKFHSQVTSHWPCVFSFCLNSPTQQCSFFSLPLKTWYRIPFMFLPRCAFWLVGSSGGLVCFSGFDCSTFKIVVCNPLTQAWRVLPSMHYNDRRNLSMVVDPKDKTFKVIATNDVNDSKSFPTEVYDSKMNSWSVHQIIPNVFIESYSKMAFCDSRLYMETILPFWNPRRYPGTDSPFGLIMYRLDTGSWEHIPAKFPRSLLEGFLFPGRQKRLFLVGSIGFSTRQSMRIWELDHSKIQWVEISRMPPEYLRALLRLSPNERYDCFGQDNLICFTTWNEVKGLSLLYDVDKKIWSWIAGCGLQTNNNEVCFYEPKFDASIY